MQELDYHVSGIILWRTVIYRAMQEAQGRMLAITVAHSPDVRIRKQRALQRAARRWLITDSDDLWTVWTWATLPGTYEEFVMRNKEQF